MNKLLQTLGLANRAGKVIVGDTLFKQMSLVKLLFVANDASLKTKERLAKKCYYYKLPCIDTFSFKELSLALGKHHIMAAGLIDEGFAKSLLNEIERRSVNGETSS